MFICERTVIVYVVKQNSYISVLISRPIKNSKYFTKILLRLCLGKKVIENFLFEFTNKIKNKIYFSLFDYEKYLK